MICMCVCLPACVCASACACLNICLELEFYYVVPYKSALTNPWPLHYKDQSL